jgi:two-component system, cell cycle sensor histidine kinase and response regulator CckA
MSKGKFLIVEDEFVVAENLRVELESMGYEIVGMAFSGNEALELARQKRPDLVLMDIKLREGMDGIETAVHLRQELDVPSFFLTAFSNESFLERAKIAEPLGYLVKPFERNGLRAGVEMAHYKARMERLLKESESRFRTMFENSPVSYLALDEGIRCFDLNSELCEFLGYDRDELIGRNFLEFCPSDKRHLYVEQFAKLKDYRRLETELELIRKDKTLLTVVLQGRVQSCIDDKSFRMHCILHNVSERKRIEEERRQAAEALWKQNALQQTLLSAIPAYVYFKDKNSIYMAGNKKFSELSGVPESEIPGKTDYDFFSETDADCFRRNDAEIFATGEARLNYEMKGADAEGNTIWYSTSKSPFYTSSGQIAGLVGICIDITEQKRLEEEHLQFEHRLQQAEKAESLGRMAGAIAHHFNNMLTAVIGNLELVTMDIPRESKSTTYIMGAMKASRRASEMSRLMLTYLGQTIAKKERLDFAKIVGETQSIFSASIPGNVHVKTEFPSRGLMIHADRVHLQQILNHLLSNALEAIGEKEGRISVAVEMVTVENIHKTNIFPMAWQPKQRSYVCLSVTDTGPGLDAVTIEKIFDPFYTTKFTGRGMGLPVVLGLIQVYEGAITVESTRGSGAVFRVYFPIVEHDELPVEKEARITPQIKGSGLVLVVEDEPLVRDMARTMLERRLGYTVIVAGDGREAIDIFQSQKDEFRFVLLDLSMPGMNGWQTLTAIRGIQPGIPVILASGFDEAQVMQGKHPELPQAFLHKPYQLSELKEAISLAETR